MCQKCRMFQTTTENNLFDFHRVFYFCQRLDKDQAVIKMLIHRFIYLKNIFFMKTEIKLLHLLRTPTPPTHTPNRPPPPPPPTHTPTLPPHTPPPPTHPHCEKM